MFTLTLKVMSEKDLNSGTEEEVTVQEEVTEESTEETHDESEEQPEIDYKKVVEEERKRREDAENKLNQTREKARERFEKSKEKKEKSEPDDDTDQPLTKTELQRILDERDQKIEKLSQENSARKIASDIASNESEAEAIVEVWKNRVVPTGNLEEDLLFAQGGLNARRMKAQNSELKRTILSKTTAAKNAASTVRDEQTTSTLRGADLQNMKDLGYTFNNKGKHWSKKLPDGTTLNVSDDQTRTWKSK